MNVRRTSMGFTHVYDPRPGAGLTLLLLHGTGGSETDLLGIGRSVAPNANLLSPRGNVLEQGMRRFFRRLAEGVFDVPDLVARAGELAAFVGAAGAVYDFDAGRVVALGFSNGANIAAGLMFLHPETLAGGILLRPTVPPSPVAPPNLAGKPVLIEAGQADPFVSPEQTRALSQMLASAGAVVTVRTYPTGQGLTPDDLHAAGEWIRNHFG